MSSTFSLRGAMRRQARVQQLDRLVTSVGWGVDLYVALDHARRAARSKADSAESLLWDLLESHVVSWIDALASRVAELGGDPRVVLEPASPDTNVVDREMYDVSLAERYQAFCRHLESTLRQPDMCNDALTEWLYTDLVSAAEVDLWFVQVDLADDVSPATTTQARRSRRRHPTHTHA